MNDGLGIQISGGQWNGYWLVGASRPSRSMPKQGMQVESPAKFQ